MPGTKRTSSPASRPCPNRTDRREPSSRCWGDGTIFDEDFIQRHGFGGFRPIRDYWSGSRFDWSTLPDYPGLYMVVRPEEFTVQFEETGSGGFYKHRDPNVGINVLRDHWVEDSRILYIGRTRGITCQGHTYRSTLRRKMQRFLRFGRGEPVDHWSGRFVWQIRNNGQLLIGYKALVNGDAGDVARYGGRLLDEYVANHGKPPFANPEEREAGPPLP